MNLHIQILVILIIFVLWAILSFHIHNQYHGPSIRPKDNNSPAKAVKKMNETTANNKAITPLKKNQCLFDSSTINDIVAIGEVIPLKIICTKYESLKVNVTFGNKTWIESVNANEIFHLTFDHIGNYSLELFSDKRAMDFIKITALKICSQFNSSSYTIMHQMGHNLLIPSQCILLNTTKIIVQKNNLLKDVNLYFLGNSHIRNLFRCSADTLSQSRSLTNQSQYLCDPQLRFTNKTYVHCLSCLNSLPIHGMDYHYNEDGISLQDLWITKWDVDLDLRDQCKDKINTKQYTSCIFQKIPGNQKYFGSRIGTDTIKNITQGIQSQPCNNFIVLNIYASINPIEILDVEFFKMLKLIQNQLILVLDIHTSDIVFNQYLDKIYQHAPNITVIDMRYVYFNYQSMISEEDIDGPGFFNENHIGVPLQKMLVQTVLSNIAIKRYHCFNSTVNLGDFIIHKQ